MGLIQFEAMVSITTEAKFMHIIDYQCSTVREMVSGAEVEHHVFVHPEGWKYCEKCSLYQPNVVHGCTRAAEDDAPHQPPAQHSKQ